MHCVGIRREDKNIWERRVALTPEHVRDLSAQGLAFKIQPSPIRKFPDSEYSKANAVVSEDISDCKVVFAVKEIPISFFQPKGIYVFFAHVIKGQEYNMPMLKRMMELGCTLIDYEKITDAAGRRLIFFGRHAGVAGMIDSLWALGQRLKWEGLDTPFASVKPAHQYYSSDEAKAHVRQIGEEIALYGLDESLTPFVCGFAGYGNVSKGAQEIYDVLAPIEISPEELEHLPQGKSHQLYKVVFHEKHTVRPKSADQTFDLHDFFNFPERYESQFDRYLRHLSMLINAIYWTPKSPRLITKKTLHQMYSSSSDVKLKVIGDISCDIEGGIEATVRATEPDDPVYVYDPLTDTAPSGVVGDGPVIMAVDNLPCELPAESSAEFSQALHPYIPAIASADYLQSFENLKLPGAIKRAVILHQGKLTDDYLYLHDYL